MRKKILAVVMAGLFFVGNFSSMPMIVNAEEITGLALEEQCDDFNAINEPIEDNQEDIAANEVPEATITNAEPVEEITKDDSTDEVTKEEESSDTTSENAEEIEVIEDVAHEESVEVEGSEDKTEDSEELNEEDEIIDDALSEISEDDLESNGDAKDATKTIIIIYNPLDVSVEAHIGNMAYSGNEVSNNNGITYIYEYTIGIAEKLSFTITASENCKINQILSQDIYDDIRKQKTFTPGNKTYTEFTTSGENVGSLIYIDTVATLKATMSQNGSDVDPVSGMYNLALNTSYSLTLTRGKQNTEFKLKSVVDISDKSKKNILNELLSNKTITEGGTFKFGKAYAGKKYDVTATIYSGTGYEQEYKFRVAVANTLTSVAVAGEKNGAIFVDDARVKRIKLSINKGADLSELRIAVTNGGKYEGSTAKIEDGYLVINGPVKYDNDESKNETVIQFKNSSNEVLHETKVLVKPTFKTLVPSISFVNSNDTDVTVKLALPKGVTLNDFSKDIYYIVEYIDENGVKKTCGAIKATDVSQNYTIKMFNVAAGQGKKADFKASVKLRTTKDGFNLDSAASRIVTVSTKSPAYETKLSLVKKTSVIVAGKKTLVAEVKYSGNTTFTQIQSAYIQGPSGKYNAIVEDNKIYVSFDSYVSSGKYKLTVTSKAKDSSCVGATSTLDYSVRGQVYGGMFEKYNSDLKSFDIYKKPNQAFALQLKLKAYDYSKNKVIPTNVDYKLIGTDGKEIAADSYLAKKVKVSNKGVLTIAKDYYLSSNNAVSFKVRAVVDQGDSTKKSIDSCLFNINAKETTISEIKIKLSNGKIIGNGDSVSADQLMNATIVCYDGNTALNTGEYSLATSNGAFKLLNVDYRYSIIDVKKAGNIKITAKTLDGGNASKSIFVKVSASENELSLNMSSVNYINGAYENSNAEIYLVVEGDSEISSLDTFKVECEKGKVVSMKNYTGIANGYLNNMQNTTTEGHYQYERNAIEKEAYTEFVYIPKTLSDTIILTNRTTGKRVRYSIRNQIFGRPIFGGKVDATNAVLYSGQRADVTYAINNYNKNSKYEVSVDIDTEAAVANLRNYANLVSTSSYRSVDMSNGEFTAELYDWVGVGDIATRPGKYKVNVFIRETKTDGKVIEYKPISSFVTLKKIPTPAVKTPKTITIGYQVGSQVKLPNMSGVIDYNLSLGNSNKGGKYNQFTNYFSIAKTSDGYVLKVKKDLTGVDVSNLEGYLRYSYRDYDYVINNKDCKVTIKVTKPAVKK